MDEHFSLLYNILTGNGQINDAVTIKSCGELNITITALDDGILMNFVEPEPTVIIHRVINVSDKINYIRFLLDGRVFVKTRGWPAEIPVNFSERA